MIPETNAFDYTMSGVIAVGEWWAHGHWHG